MHLQYNSNKRRSRLPTPLKTWVERSKWHITLILKETITNIRLIWMLRSSKPLWLHLVILVKIAQNKLKYKLNWAKMVIYKTWSWNMKSKTSLIRVNFRVLLTVKLKFCNNKLNLKREEMELLKLKTIKNLRTLKMRIWTTN